MVPLANEPPETAELNAHSDRLKGTTILTAPWSDMSTDTPGRAEDYADLQSRAAALVDEARRGVEGTVAAAEEALETGDLAEAARLLGGIDSVFCCVGRSGRGEILHTSADRLREFLEANLLAAVELTNATADDVARAGGSLVYIGSLAGKLASPFVGPYAVGKAALAAYADAVRLELVSRGGHVLLVSPGPIGRRDDDPAAEAAIDRYAAEIREAGLPCEAAAPGGTKSLTPLDPDALAARVLDACRRRRSELVVPGKAAVLAGLIDWFPDAGRRLLARSAL